MSVENEKVGFPICMQMTSTKNGEPKQLQNKKPDDLVNDATIKNLNNTGIVILESLKFSTNPSGDTLDGSIKILVPANFDGDRMLGILQKIKSDLNNSGIKTQKMIYDAPDEFSKPKGAGYINFSINPVK